MNSTGRVGRPKASSKETLAEAACELFLEQGFEATSIADITSRAGVSRSSFFNYFASKSDILWAGLDERLTAFEERLEKDDGADAAADVRAAVLALGSEFAPDSLALAIVNATAMGLESELDREGALRRTRIGRAVADRLSRGGADRLHAEVAGAAWGGAVIAAVEAWAHDGAGVTSLERFLSRAADAAGSVALAPAAGEVRQLRVVVRAADFDEALAFYRDVVGMSQSEAYEAEGGARVAILDAGRATLELSNPAQVEFIDRVETDGVTSDRIRLALEVDDAAGATDRLAAAGAEVEASARQTPWRSLNSRLRGPAELQLTLFQELGPE
ncbi:TetR family transcriptional regulator [Microbacterium sp. CFH 31415]|uniref:TetR family transcriptional regulator n=1 Tax=Microbacterium sp. CFH 31415 TaxID=2921732 RepID=UPI001F13377F|nr:TetR family transcriptional regulator [Microbacterium sp. CFH 31415]MCH6229306.1 TetR family transcriptional regulator [Microbacterium sp. CFH 31415]